MNTNQFGMTTQEAVEAAVAGLPVKRFYTHKFGRNSTLASGENLSEPGQAYPHLTSGATGFTVRVKAGGNAADAAAGVGAREVTVQGLSPSYGIQQAILTLNADGTLASAASTELFIRILRVFVSGTGTGRVNTGDITIEAGTGGQDYALIPAGKGQGYIGYITVPAGYKGYLADIIVRTDIASGTGSVEVTAFSRANSNIHTAPYPSKKAFWDVLSLDKTNGSKAEVFNPPLEFNEYTDIWLEAVPSSGTPGVEVEFTMLFERANQ